MSRLRFSEEKNRIKYESENICRCQSELFMRTVGQSVLLKKHLIMLHKDKYMNLREVSSLKDR